MATFFNLHICVYIHKQRLITLNLGLGGFSLQESGVFRESQLFKVWRTGDRWALSPLQNIMSAPPRLRKHRRRGRKKTRTRRQEKISVECSLLGITQVLKTSSHQACTGLGLSIINHRLEKAEGGPMHPWWTLVFWWVIVFSRLPSWISKEQFQNHSHTDGPGET